MQTINRPPAGRARPAPFRFTVAMYFAMSEKGLLRETDRVELIDGEILTMSPIEMPHMTCVVRTTTFFTLALQGRALAWPQGPIRALGQSIPQPDIALVADRDYVRRHPPEADDIFLVVEVADTSLRYDQTVKAKLYAQSNIREYWLFDLRHRRIIVHRDPVDGVYQDIKTFGPEDSISPLAFPDITLVVGTVLA